MAGAKGRAGARKERGIESDDPAGRQACTCITCGQAPLVSPRRRSRNRRSSPARPCRGARELDLSREKVAWPSAPPREEEFQAERPLSARANKTTKDAISFTLPREIRRHASGAGTRDGLTRSLPQLVSLAILSWLRCSVEF